MATQADARVDCLLIGEYVDEADVPPNLQVYRGEVARPEVVAVFVDDGAGTVMIQEIRPAASATAWLRPT
jgi:hypothetical protein